MAYVNFGKTQTKAEALESNNDGKIFFPIDDNSIILNQKIFGKSTWFGTCSTAAETAAKVVNCPNFVLTQGAIIGVRFNYTNTASNCTINVNGTGAKQIWYNNTVYTDINTSIQGVANRTTYYMYDGTYWVFIRDGIINSDDHYTTAWSSTGAGTADKNAYCTNYAIKDPSYIHVLVRYSNTVASALTLNINSQGAKPIYINGQPSSATNYDLLRGTYLVRYENGIYWFNTDNVAPIKISIANIVDMDYEMYGDSNKHPYVLKDNSLYPVAHPDLSTQPSLLPQRFGNKPLYEVLSRVKMGSNQVVNFLLPISSYSDVSSFASSVGASSVSYQDYTDSNIITWDLSSTGSITGYNYYAVINNELCIYNPGSTCYIRRIKNLILNQNDNSVHIYKGNLNGTASYNDQIILPCDIIITTGGEKYQLGYNSDGFITVEQLNTTGSYLLDIPSNAITINATAFNDVRCSPVAVYSSNTKYFIDFGTHTDSAFIPSYVLVQYYIKENSYYV